MIRLATVGRHSCAGKNSNLPGKMYQDKAISSFASSVNHLISVHFFSRVHKTSKIVTNWMADRLKEFIKGNSELKKKP